jgi:hypothetical protein
MKSTEKGAKKSSKVEKMPMDNKVMAKMKKSMGKKAC